MKSEFFLIFAFLLFFLGAFIGWLFEKKYFSKQLEAANRGVETILRNAENDASNIRKSAKIDAKELKHKYRAQLDQEIAVRRNELQDQEKVQTQRDASLGRKDDLLEQKEQILLNRQNDLDNREKKIEKVGKEADDFYQKQEAKLSEIAQLTNEQARDLILTRLNDELENTRAEVIRNSENEAKLVANKKAKQLVVEAMERSAADSISENSVSFVNLPDDDMKGRIIGREGRNIKSFETLTGVDLIIDDTPDIVTISSFDPIRREIAKLALEKLVSDGRIHPARIESMVEKARKDIDEKIRDIGEKVVFDLGIRKIHPDLIKVLGRLNYRTSYGQNVLQHSIEVAKLSAIMAAEMDEDENMAKLAGLLHDIGKALDIDTTGSHVDLGVEITKRYHEPDIVVNTIASHHGDTEPTSIIASLVAAADAMSAARPGARSESLEQYINRLKELENISTSFKGVDHSFAIQAGREVRVIVKPDKISEDQSTILAHDIKEKIENEMDYPGYIKVTVVRETRRVEVAK